MSKELLSHLPAGHGWTLIEPGGDCAFVCEQPVIGWFVHSVKDDTAWNTVVVPITAEGVWDHDAEEFLLRHFDGTLMAPNNTMLEPQASPLQWFRERRARLGLPLATEDEVQQAARPQSA